MTSIDFDKVCDLLDNDKETKWVTRDRVMRDMDVIRQIRTPIDTRLTVEFNDITVLEKDLAKGDPLTLNLPVFAAPYGSLSFRFHPDTPFDQNAIRLDEVARIILFSVDTVKVPCCHLVFEGGVIKRL